MKELRGLFIHGVGQQGPSFADESRRLLRETCEARGVSSYFMSAHWAPAADKAEHQFLSAAQAQGSEGNIMQQLSVGTLADALYYQSSPELKTRIFDTLDTAAVRLGAATHPLVIFAHSLGGLLVCDWLRCRPALKRVRLVTMGCNVGLFSLGSRFDCPSQVRAPGTWTNLWHKRDVLGYPLAISAGLEHVRDVRVNLGGLFRGWTGLSHLLYWGNAKLWQKTIPHELGL